MYISFWTMQHPKLERWPLCSILLVPKYCMTCCGFCLAPKVTISKLSFAQNVCFAFMMLCFIATVLCKFYMAFCEN